MRDNSVDSAGLLSPGVDLARDMAERVSTGSTVSRRNGRGMEAKVPVTTWLGRPGLGRVFELALAIFYH